MTPKKYTPIINACHNCAPGLKQLCSREPIHLQGGVCLYHCHEMMPPDDVLRMMKKLKQDGYYGGNHDTRD